MMKDSGSTYETHDIALATTLSYYGIDPDDYRPVRGEKVLFVYRGANRLYHIPADEVIMTGVEPIQFMDLVDRIESYKARVDPYKFLKRLRGIKTRIHAGNRK